MKKLLAIVVLGLFWSNTSFAERIVLECKKYSDNEYMSTETFDLNSDPKKDYHAVKFDKKKKEIRWLGNYDFPEGWFSIHYVVSRTSGDGRLYIYGPFQKIDYRSRIALEGEGIKFIRRGAISCKKVSGEDKF